MLGNLALAYQLHQPPSFDSQAALYDALRGPKVTAVSGSPNRLEQRLQAQAGSARTLSLSEVKTILSRPYLNPATDRYSIVYSDLVSRGMAINHALDNFPYAELKGLPINEYLSKLRDFQSFHLDFLSQNLIDIFTFLITRDPNATTILTGQRALRTELLNQMSEFLYGGQ